MGKKLLNIVLSQAAWFAAVLGAAKGMPWLGPLALLPHPFSPPWMVALWLNFAAMLNVSLTWLRGRYLLAIFFGATGGPLAYYGGAKLGATQGLPSLGGIMVLVVGWGVMTPLLVWIAQFYRFQIIKKKD